MKHTPGPWIAEGQGAMRDGGSSRLHPCFNGRIKSTNGISIVSYSSFLGVIGETVKQAEANARLIAAAPELLEACKFAISIIGHPDDAGTQIIAAAIRKAEGQ